MGRKVIDREKLRERILDQAEQMIRRRGLVRSRMTDLVRSSGVSRRTFYTVFGSREEVIRSVIDRKVTFISSRVTDVVAGDHSTEEKLQAMLGMAQKVTALIPPDLLHELATAHPEVWDYINEQRMKVFGLWRQILEEGQRRGDVRRDVDPEFFMHVLTTVAQHMVNPTFLSEHDMTISDTIHQMKELFLYGLLPREPGEGREVGR